MPGLEQVLNTQISQHKKQEANHSCLEQLVGLVYHADADSLNALEKLQAEVHRHQQLHPNLNLAKKCAQQIHLDQQALAQRIGINRVFSDVAENAALLVRGRFGLAITLGTYALKHIKPADSLPDMALGAGTGIAEGSAFRLGVHFAEKATHHASITAMRYLKNALKPSFQTAESFCTDTLKSWKHEANPLLEILPETIIYRLPATDREAFQAVTNSMAHIPPAVITGPLFIAEHNVQYGNAEKAVLYHQSYEHMFSRAHLIFLEEVDPEFCSKAAASIDYKFCASRTNSRGQGLGFLLHPRLEVIGEPINLESLAQVHHIPDLRPGFMVHLKDTHTGAEFDAIAVHLKSMRGGGYTHAIRYAQTTSLANLISDRPTIVGGDWNYFLDQPEREMAPLQHAGFQLLDPASNIPTQEFGGRLDGFMTRNVPWNFGNSETFNFWQDLPRSNFSDHGMLRVSMDTNLHTKK